MTKIILIRHAESTWVEKAASLPIKLFGGRMNACPLSVKGKEQS